MHNLEKFVPNAKQIVNDAVIDAAKDPDVLIVEGSGSPSDAAFAAYLSNHYVVEMFSGMAVLASDCLRGNSYSQIAGTIMLLPEAYRSKLLGYVLNRVIGRQWPPMEFETVSKVLGISQIGYVAHRDPNKAPEPFTPGQRMVGNLAELRVDSWFDDVAHYISRDLQMERIIDGLPECQI